MLNLLIYVTNINNCKKIIKSISNLSFYVKVHSIATSAFEIKNTIATSNIDLIIIDNDITYKNIIQEKLFEQYDIPIIILNKKIINYKYKALPHIIFIDNYNLLCDKIMFLVENYYNSNSLKLAISKELDYLRFNPNHIGTMYLIEVISQIYYNYTLLNNLTKSVYPNISKKYSISINTLKCDIFQASLYSYISCEENRLENYIGRSCLEKPSLKTYIYSIIEHLKLGTLKDSVPNQSIEDYVNN